MDLIELKKRKEELGYTNEELAEISGVPLGTVQRIMSGETKNPRRDTWNALEKALSPEDAGVVKEKGFEYGTRTGKKQGEYTVDDYYALPDDVNAELIDGVIYYMTPSPTTAHQYVMIEITKQISNCIEKSGKKCIVLPEIDVQLDKDDKTIVRPDVAVVCDTERINQRCIYGAPDIVIEVLSPSTRRKDMTVKMKKYLEAGVSVYWMVDVKRKVVISYDFQEEDFAPKISGFKEKMKISLPEGECEIDLRNVEKQLEEVFNS